ncbi:DNA primase, UL52/UL70 type, Herpesviridae [Parasponia andersonii]|uniref:DNA-directed primase/polymerase protein n=1 Tax=Parasponia andersonii TaxID=3476 RepID=A0A2P5CAX4_PARAD|nr:DNA primase, UL52/UL70 type, Herpesviridae [Parasponia andersonii]
MDYVDRLFQSFKCGISPPQSAVRERKRSRSKLRHELSPHSIILSPDSETHKPKKLPKIQPSAMKISPLVFYGSPHGVPPKRPSRLFLRLLNEIRNCLGQQSKSSLSRAIWSTFPRQEEAMKFAKGHDHARVFSYQDHFNGQRRFLVSTYKEFWKRYKNMESKFRHHYEVIQEGLPCHLYFDLEFSRRENTDRDGDEMVDLLISVILEALLDKYSIKGNREWILELDSSTDVKFSRHLIIRIPKTAFKDNSHAGVFVNEIWSRIFSGKEKDGRFEKLFVKKESNAADSPSQLFVDTAVYSRNRCFRLALSSKAGKNSVLLPTGRYRVKNMCEEDMFMASLICNMDVDCEKLLVCKMDLLCVKTLQFNTEVNHNSGRCFSCPQELTLDGCGIDASATYFMGKSPFPALDTFIESVASIGNVSGKIRSWYLFSDYGLMVYSMSRNRYCERIGREHKSNHVMYVVDLRRADYYQKCYDPDCRGYRSPLRPVPLDIIPDMVDHGGSEVYNEECFNDKSTTNNSTPDSWWLEAMRLADNVEKRLY